MNISKLLDPKLINSVADLELIAKMIAENATLGINKSLKTGFGQEFSQYRSYEPGDDLRYLDWKLFARNDRYYIRHSEVESNITVRFIVDCSASMNHEYDGLKKIDFVKLVVATLAYIAFNQHDRIVLHGLHQNRISTFQFSDTKPVFHQFLNHLIHLDIGQRIHVQTEHLLKEIHSTRKELIIFVSDMYERESEITVLLKQLFNMKEEVILFHVLAEDEIDLNLITSENLEDLETGRVIRNTQTKDYTKRIKNFIEEIESYMVSNEGTYHLFNSFKHVDEEIRTFLTRRDRMMG